MLNLSIAELKVVFNARAIMTPAERFQTRLRRDFGAYCRIVMRNSLKMASRPHQVSEPGATPFRHGGDGKGTDYKDTIFYADDPQRKEVAIGAALLEGTAAAGQSVPGALEFGGQIIKWRDKTRTVRIAVYVRARPHARPAYDIAVQRKLPGLIAGGIMRAA